MRYLILILFVFIGCDTSTNKHPIDDPEMGAAFYMDAYTEVEEQYEEAPTDQLLKQKLYYLEMMGWPPMAISSLQQAKNSWGLSEELVNMYTNFYLKNQHYAELKDMLNTWAKLHQLDEKMMEANIVAHEELSLRSITLDLLNDYIYDHHQPDNQEFVARQYLKLGDTLMSIYHFSKLSKQDPNRKSLVNEYVPLLLTVNQPLRARKILGNSNQADTTTQTQLMLARSLYQLGEKSRAKNILRQKDNPVTLEVLTQWFWEEEQWDSATVYVNRLIALDSARQWIFMKASILDERGWLNASYDQFNYLVATDSTDLIARERAEEVARKIAYLRDLRESRKDTTVLQLTPKRLDNE